MLTWLWHKHRWSAVSDYQGPTQSIINFQCLDCGQRRVRVYDGSVQIEDLT